MNKHHRLKALECSYFEAEIARLDAFFNSFTEADLDVIISGFKTGLSSPVLERYVSGMNSFAEAVFTERERRIRTELRRTGWSEAEITKVMGE